MLKAFGRWEGFVSHLQGHRYEDESPLYLQRLEETMASKGLVLDEGTRLYRARLMPAGGWLSSYKPLDAKEMGAPPAHLASAGRLNYQGSSVLYTAESQTVAISEVRPWNGARISMATLALNRELRVLDLVTTADGTGDPLLYDMEWISHVMGQPQHRDDMSAYLGTQRFGAVARDLGFEGVRYSSASGAAGANVAIFDTEAFAVVQIDFVEVDQVAVYWKEVEEDPSWSTSED